MNILFCGKAFPQAFQLLKALLPDEDVCSCAGEHVVRLGMVADVLIPLMHRLEPELIGGTAAKLIHQWGGGARRGRYRCCNHTWHNGLQRSRRCNSQC